MLSPETLKKIIDTQLDGLADLYAKSKAVAWHFRIINWAGNVFVLCPIIVSQELLDSPEYRAALAQHTVRPLAVAQRAEAVINVCPCKQSMVAENTSDLEPAKDPNATNVVLCHIETHDEFWTRVYPVEGDGLGHWYEKRGGDYAPAEYQSFLSPRSTYQVVPEMN